MTEKDENESVVRIGNKPVLSYALAVITEFNKGNNEVLLKARGRAISRAVDVAEIIRNKFIPNVRIEEIKTGLEKVERENGEKIDISSMEIRLKLPSE